MLRYFVLAVAASFGLSAPAAASLINFEYIVEDRGAAAADGRYQYDFQFWVDRSDPTYQDTLSISNVQVNVSVAQGPRPFGTNFITDVPAGFAATDQTGLPNNTRIALSDGTNWVPTADDFALRFTGRSDVLADMTWNYTGFFVDGVSNTIFTGTPPRDRTFLTATPSGALTAFDTPAPIPLPAGLPLLLAGLGGLALFRRRTA